MKKLLLILSLVLSTVGQAQTTIEGIGKIKLEMSLSDAKKAFPKMLLPIKGVSKFKKVYKINAYTPIKGHTLRDIHLYFYNDTLYAFYIKNIPSLLKESLSAKYGEQKKKIVSFQHHLLEIASIYEDDAADFLLEATKKTKSNMSDFFYSWNEGNPFLQCVLVESLYTNENNKRDLDRMFYMRNRATAKIIELKEKLQQEEEKENRRKELDNL